MQQQAVNTFNEGINFDLNPITTPNNVLTDCINGTFITFNGDELSLQNDAGNTKIEYATQENITTIYYGFLYNWPIVIDSKKITSSDDWIVLSWDSYNSIQTYLGGASVTGGKLKEIGIDHWNTPNTGATNETLFNGRGSGWRNASSGGIFSDINNTMKIWLSSPHSPNEWGALSLSYNSSNASLSAGTSSMTKKYGYGIRLMKSSTTLTNGQTGTYIGNNGVVYNTIAIGSPAIEVLSENLIETKFRTGDDIPEVTDNTTWAGLTTGARCSYDNTQSNAYITAIENITNYVQLSSGFYPLGIKEYGGVLYIVSGKLPADPKTNINITLWVQGTSYLQNKVVYKDFPTERLYYKAKKNTSADLPIVTSQDWEVIGNEKDYNNMFGEVEFGSYPSPSASGSVLYEGNTVNFIGTMPETIYRWTPTGLNSYCLTDVNGKNTGYRMTEEQYQTSTDGGLTWVDDLGTPVRNVSVINTTTCPLPIAFVGMVLDPSIYNIPNEYPVAYVPGQNTLVNTPIKPGFNYLFFSVPSTLTLTIIDAMGIDITNGFSVFGVDNRPAYQTNTIYRKNDMFATEQSTKFTLIFA